MGRLIDADEAIKSFEKYDSFMDEPLTERDAYLIECVLTIFDSRPTAYDIEAVVKKLEAIKTSMIHRAEEATAKELEFPSLRNYAAAEGLEIAIEVVKRGGRDE